MMVILYNFYAYPESTGKQEPQFKISDIFIYNHPERKTADEKKWGFNISGSYIQKKGNTDNMRTNFSTSAQYDDNITSFKIAGTGAYGKTSGIKDENRGSLSLNFDHYLIYHLELFTYTMSDYNEITELEHRNNSGAGLKFVFIRNRYLLMDISAAPVLQYEKYEQLDRIVDWRWSLRGRAEIFPWSDNFTLKYHVYYIQKINDMDNYRAIHDVSIYKKLIGVIGVRAGYRREYDTYTAKYLAENPLVKKTDSTFYCQASISF